MTTTEQPLSALLNPSSRTTLDEFIARLNVLQAQGAGQFPVLIETRNQRGAVIYARANARKDSVVRVDGGGYRLEGTAIGRAVPVVRIG